MRTRRREDRGSGVLGTTFGVGVFLVLLLFASHLLLNLWLIAGVDGIARDAAISVATSGAGPSTTQAAESLALQRAREALGGYADRVELEFEEDPTGRAVVLHVVAPELSLLPPLAARFAGATGVDRRIVIVREHAE